MSLRDRWTPIWSLLRGRPVMAVFEICLRCNSRCGYCDLPLNQGRDEMTRAEIRAIFTALYRQGLRYLFVQGGEPLVRRDTLEVLEDLSGIGYGLCLVTNGTKLTPEVVERLARLSVSVSVSLDSLDRETYHQVSGADQLPRVLRGLETLDGYPHPKFIACIVTERNRGDVEAVCRFARARGFAPVLGAYHWDVGKYGKADPRLAIAREQAAQTFEAMLESGLLPPGYYRAFAGDSVDWLRGRRLGRCDAGRYSLAIDASGNVAPCLAMPFAGNLRRQDLDEILDGIDRRAVEACSRASSCNLLCGRLVGRNLRNPWTAAATPMKLRPDA